MISEGEAIQMYMENISSDIAAKLRKGLISLDTPSHQYKISNVEIRRAYDCLISTMRFLILVRRHIYIETQPRGPFY